MLRALRSAAAAAGYHFDGCLPAWLHSARSISSLHDELLPVVSFPLEIYPIPLARFLPLPASRFKEEKAPPSLPTTTLTKHVFSPFQVAIVGRPNVGKSALFNRLARARKSIVHDTPDGHVTRDYQEAPAQLGDLRFLAIDTSGLEPLLPSGSIQARATGLTTQVLRRADVAMLLLDGRVGVLPGDAALARWLRGPAADVAEKVLLVANKCERRRRDGGAGVGWVLAEASSLGFGEPVALSAETGEGLAELYEALAPRLDPLLRARRAAVEEIGGELGDDRDDDVLNLEANTGGGRGSRRGQRARRAEDDDSKARPVRIAIMGLVNVVRKTTLASQQHRCCQCVEDWCLATCDTIVIVINS
jgi:small GTP-binding protein